MEQVVGMFLSLILVAICSLSGYDCSGFWPEQTSDGHISTPHDDDQLILNDYSDHAYLEYDVQFRDVSRSNWTLHA